MHSGETGRWRTYGTRRFYTIFAGNAALSTVTFGYPIAVVVESATTGRPLSDPGRSIFLVVFGMAFVAFVVIGPIMYGPRTRPGHITAGSDNGLPALILRQSQIVFMLAPTMLASITVGLAALSIDAYLSDPYPNEYALEVTILVITVTCGWQAGFLLLVLLRRIRPGHIAIRHDGIRIREVVADIWIPWNAVRGSAEFTDPLFAVICMSKDSGAVRTECVPRPWQGLDRRPPGDFPLGRFYACDFHHVNRRCFRIAPELIDAAV